MLLIDLLQHTAPSLAHITTWSDVHQGLQWSSAHDWSLLAQQFNTDVFANSRGIFNNFIKSGQVWALLIGVIIGYILRGMGTYG